MEKHDVLPTEDVFLKRNSSLIDADILFWLTWKFFPRLDNQHLTLSPHFHSKFKKQTDLFFQFIVPSTPIWIIKLSVENGNFRKHALKEDDVKMQT